MNSVSKVSAAGEKERKTSKIKKELERERQTQSAGRVQKEPEGQMVGGQKEKGTPVGAEVLSEEDRKRKTRGVDGN